MNKRVRISSIPLNKTFDDYPDDTIFLLDEEDEDNWDDIVHLLEMYAQLNSV